MPALFLDSLGLSAQMNIELSAQMGIVEDSPTHLHRQESSRLYFNEEDTEGDISSLSSIIYEENGRIQENGIFCQPLLLCGGKTGDSDDETDVYSIGKEIPKTICHGDQETLDTTDENSHESFKDPSLVGLESSLSGLSSKNFDTSRKSNFESIVPLQEKSEPFIDESSCQKPRVENLTKAKSRGNDVREGAIIEPQSDPTTLLVGSHKVSKRTPLPLQKKAVHNNEAEAHPSYVNRSKSKKIFKRFLFFRKQPKLSHADLPTSGLKCSGEKDISDTKTQHCTEDRSEVAKTIDHRGLSIVKTSIGKLVRSIDKTNH